MDLEKNIPSIKEHPQDDECPEETVQEYQVTLVDECWAEFLGTAILVAFGDGVVAQKVLSDGGADVLTIHICWGLAVFMGVLVSFRTSGAVLNPALLFGFWSLGKFPAKKILPYSLSQIAGGFMGAALVYLFYFDSLSNNRSMDTATIFFTAPAPYMSWAGAFFDEVIATALLMLLVAAITATPQNQFVVGSSVASLVVAIGMAFGANTGYAINPARDFGPRLFTLTAGWGTIVFSNNGYYFLIPIFAPILGAIIGAQINRSHR